MMEIVLTSYVPPLVGMLAIALAVLMRKRSPVYITFSLLIMCIVGWLSLQAMSLVVETNDALLLARISVFLGNFLAPLFLIFAISFPSRERFLGLRETFLIFLPAILLASFSFSPYMIESAAKIGPNLALSTGIAYDIQTLYIVVAILASLGLLIWKYFHVARKERVAITMLLSAFILPVIAGVFTNYIWINNPGAQYFVPVTLLVTASIIMYAMVKHGLFDIRLAAVRGAAYVLSLMTLGTLYYVAALIISELFLSQGDKQVVTSPLSVGLALLLAFIFQPVKRFFDRLTNNIFFHDDYNTNDFIARLGDVLSATSDLRSLLQRASNEISTTIQAEQSFFFVYNRAGHYVSAGTSHHGQIGETEVSKISEYVAKNQPGAIVTDILQDSELVHDLLRRHNIALVLPLMYSGKAMGYLFVGQRRSRSYTMRDVRTLETIADELVIAIQNTLSIQEVKELNETLQQRIDDATKELRASNAQLQRLDEAKDEFVSMASHQLRTPLTSVKGYISMVLEGDVGKITATQRRLLGEAYTSSERMVHLINDFLNVSRLQTGKFMLERRPVDLSKVVEQEVESLQTTAKAHNLQLKFRKPSYFPVLYIDEGKLRQVLMNFIDNAIYYSHEGTAIDIKLEVTEGDAILTVKDTGIGVPKSEQAHLFSKFFRATNARKQRPDGTGVGLFLAKKVIDAHGGSMIFESVEGEGSTFGVRLPVKKLSSAPKDNSNELDK